MKTNEQRADEIDLFLRSLHVFSMQPQERRQIAMSLAGCGQTVGSIRMVWDEARASAGNEDDRRGLFAKTLRQPALVADIVRDLEDRRGRVKGGAGSEPSGMQFVAEGNPYGWKEPGNVRHLDHGRPGEWNAYRQAYNMTEQERLEAGVHDCRRQGCSRVEVVGEFDKTRVKAGKDIGADPFFDPAVLLGHLRDAEDAAGGRGVYGA